MPLRVVTLAGSMEWETRVATTFASEPRLELSFRCVDRAEALATLRAGDVDVILAVGACPWFDFQCVEEAHRSSIKLYGLAADPVETEMLEVGGFTVIEDLDALKVLGSGGEAADLERTEERGGGKVVAVWGPKGSPGRTLIATELATLFGRQDPATLLVDADTYGGDAAQLLGVVEDLPGIIAISRSAARGELRADDWVGSLRRVHDGPVLLPGLLRADLWDEVSSFGWTHLLASARRCFNTSVWDVGFCLEEGRSAPEGRGRNDIARTTVTEADHVVAVLRADPIGVKSFIWAYTDHRDLLDDDRVLVVVNRVRAGDRTEIKDLIRRHVGRLPVALLPDRPDHVQPANWEGVPVTSREPGSPVSEGIRELAGALGASVPTRGFLSRLAGRRAGV